MRQPVLGSDGAVGRLTTCCAAAIALSSVACNAQVGADYTGEIMLTLRGHIEAVPKGADDRVPALAFWGANQQLQVVDGQVRGVFPSDFRLDIAAPPPPLAIFEGAAIGGIVLVRREHPSAIEYPLPEITYPVEGAEPGAPYLEHRKYCLSSGACLERDLECVRRPCEIIDESGPPPVSEHDVAADLLQFTECFGDVCYRAAVSCSSLESCHRRFSRCEDSLQCDILSETGDPAVLAYTDYPLITRNLSIIYITPEKAAEASVTRPGAQPGYNVLVSATSLMERADKRRQGPELGSRAKQ